MLVGTKAIPAHELKEAAKSIKTLKQYALELVPYPLRHITQVTDNQKYLVAITLRSVLGVSYKDRVRICEELLEGVTVTGLLNEIVDFSDIMETADVALLIKALELERERRDDT